MGNRGINEGRQCAREVDEHLMNSTYLPVTGGIVQRTVPVAPKMEEVKGVEVTVAA